MSHFDPFRPDDAGDATASYVPRPAKGPRSRGRIIATVAGVLMLAAAALVAVLVA